VTEHSQEVEAARSHPPREVLSGDGLPPQAVAWPRQPVQEPAIASPHRDAVWMGRPSQRSLVEIRTVSGPGAGRVWPLGMGVHDIGSAPGSTIEISGNGIPERGVQVKIDPSGRAWLVLPADAAGASPIRVSMISPPEDEHIRQRKAGETPWPTGSDLVLGDVLLRVTSPSVADAAVVTSDGPGYDYIRVPRTVPPLPGGRYRLPQPPTIRHRSQISTGLTVATVLLVSIGVAWLLSSFFLLVFVLVSFAVAGLYWISTQRPARRAFLGDLKAHWEVRAATNAGIRQMIAEERKLRCDTLMDPACAALTAIGPGHRLWERRRGDADHLVLRVGTVDQPSAIEIEEPAREGAQRLFRWNLHDVPFGVDVAARGVLGLVGEDSARRAIAGWMVIQAAVLHSPRELQLCLLTDGSAQTSWDWRWVRRLPHIWRGQAVLAGGDPKSVSQCVEELASVVRARGLRSAGAASPMVFGGPDILVVLDGSRRLRNVEPIARILAEGPALRVFSICLDEHELFLPRECTSVVRCDPAAVAVSQQDLPDFAGIRPDLVTAAWCDRIASSLTQLHDLPMPQDAAPVGSWGGA